MEDVLSVVNTIIASLALVVSIFSLVKQYLKSKLFIRIINVTKEEDTFKVEFGISNVGDKPCTVNHVLVGPIDLHGMNFVKSKLLNSVQLNILIDPGAEVVLTTNCPGVVNERQIIKVSQHNGKVYKRAFYLNGKYSFQWKAFVLHLFSNIMEEYKVNYFEEILSGTMVLETNRSRYYFEFVNKGNWNSKILLSGKNPIIGNQELLSFSILNEDDRSLKEFAMKLVENAPDIIQLTRDEKTNIWVLSYTDEVCLRYMSSSGGQEYFKKYDFNIHSGVHMPTHMISSF